MLVSRQLSVAGTCVCVCVCVCLCEQKDLSVVNVSGSSSTPASRRTRLVHYPLGLVRGAGVGPVLPGKVFLKYILKLPARGYG